MRRKPKVRGKCEEEAEDEEEEGDDRDQDDRARLRKASQDVVGVLDRQRDHQPASRLPDDAHPDELVEAVEQAGFVDHRVRLDNDPDHGDDRAVRSELDVFQPERRLVYGFVFEPLSCKCR